jgi:hypothetical protein
MESYICCQCNEIIYIDDVTEKGYKVNATYVLYNLWFII